MVDNRSTIIPEDLVRILHAAQKIAVLTGAGISAESNIPTFREAQTGLWSQYNPQELATRQAFRNNPRLVWEWYSWRRELISAAKPNAAHIALAYMESTLADFTLITQNIDGLHKSAGSKNIIELHGDINRFKCFDEDRIVEKWDETVDIPPRCPYCNGQLRPDVVWFGETLKPDDIENALYTANNCDIFFSIGTSGVVEPAASLPYLALQNGASLVEINATETPLSSAANYSLRGAAGVILPALIRETWQKLS